MTAIVLPQLRGANLLTNSRMSTMKSCPRKHLYRYEMGIRPRASSRPLRMGGAVHIGLDLRAKGIAPDDAILRATEGYEVLPDWATTDETVHEWKVEREKVARLLSGYFWRWGVGIDGYGDPDVVEVLASEIAFDLPLRNPETGGASTVFRAAGKIDKIVRLTDGRIAVMEHKTCGEDIGPDSDYWRRLRIDHQISLYLHAARELGYAAETVLYDVIRKPSIAPKQVALLDEQGRKIVLDAAGQRVFNAKGEPRQTGDTERGYTLQVRVETAGEYGERLNNDIAQRPDFYFARQEIPRLDADMEEFAAELWQQQQSIRDAQRHGRWFRNTSACLTMGRCEYLDWCHAGISPDALPGGFVRVDDIHPELATGDDE